MNAHATRLREEKIGMNTELFDQAEVFAATSARLARTAARACVSVESHRDALADIDVVRADLDQLEALLRGNQ